MTYSRTLVMIYLLALIKMVGRNHCSTVLIGSM